MKLFSWFDRFALVLLLVSLAAITLVVVAQIMKAKGLL